MTAGSGAVAVGSGRSGFITGEQRRSDRSDRSDSQRGRVSQGGLSSARSGGGQRSARSACSQASGYTSMSTPRMGYGTSGGFEVAIEVPQCFTDRSACDSAREDLDAARDGGGGYR